MTRISVGVDVSKNRSTVCIMDQDGKFIMRPFLVWHSTEELDFLADTLKRLNGEVRVIMESTSVYQYPIALQLKERGLFISIVNAYEMKQFANIDFRGGKTGKKDSRTIASYGISYWDKLVEWQIPKDTYFNLDLLNRTYMNAKKHRQIILQELQHYIDCAMPGMDKELHSLNLSTKKDFMLDFVEKFWHRDEIVNMTEAEFTEVFTAWAKEKGYRPGKGKAAKIYAIAKSCIPYYPSNPTVKTILQCIVDKLSGVNRTLVTIVTQMIEEAKKLPEYQIVREMPGVGDPLAARFFGSAGDIRRFKNSKALVAYAGIDSPPDESGDFSSTHRHITKKGSKVFRDTGYEIMMALRAQKRTWEKVRKNPEVYDYMLREEAEGKPRKVAKIAALNKFLRIIYARIKELYDNMALAERAKAKTKSKTKAKTKATA